MIFILFNLCLKGQETKLVVKYFNKTNQIMEKYYVLVDSPNVKHGEFVQYFESSPYSSGMNQDIKKNGFYYKNKPDSTWIYYSLNQRGNYNIIKTEKYNKGKKTGIWETYVEGFIIKRFDYDSNKELKPVFICKTNIKYPEIAKENNIEGTVTVKVDYDNGCTIKKIYILQSDSRALDSSAFYAVKDYENKKMKYLRLINDCPTEKDTTYVINFKLNH
jgi:TonB family protein